MDADGFEPSGPPNGLGDDGEAYEKALQESSCNR